MLKQDLEESNGGRTVVGIDKALELIRSDGTNQNSAKFDTERHTSE